MIALATIDDKAPALPVFTHRWVLRRVLPERYHQLCRIIPKQFARGWSASFADPRELITLEFRDGVRVEASRVAIRSVRRPSWIQGGNNPRKG